MPTTSVTLDMRQLRAVALAASNDPMRPTLTEVAVVDDLALGTDSYRLHAATPEQLTLQGLLDRIAGIDSKQVDNSPRIPATLIREAEKTSKSGPVEVTWDDGDVTLTTAKGTYTDRACGGMFPNVRTVTPRSAELHLEPGACAAFNPEYLADIGKIGAILAHGARKDERGGMTARAYQLGALRPSLWWVGGLTDHPAAMALLMPVRVPA